jgi:hypothetical protein
VTSTRLVSLSASEPRTADLKVERNSIQARATIAEAEAMPQCNAPKVLGLGGGSEHTIRLLIAPHGAVLRSARDRIDGRGVVTAINRLLKPHWSAVDSQLPR